MADFQTDPDKVESAEPADVQAADTNEAPVVEAAPETSDVAGTPADDSQDNTPAPEVAVEVVLSADWAKEHNVEKVNVGTALGEYVVTTDPQTVTAEEADLLEASPAVEVVS